MAFYHKVFVIFYSSPLSKVPIKFSFWLTSPFFKRLVSVTRIGDTYGDKIASQYNFLLFPSIFLYSEVKYEIIYFMIFQFNSKIPIWFTTRWRARDASTKPWQISSSTLVGFLSWLSPLVELENFIFTVMEFFGYFGQVFGWVWSILWLKLNILSHNNLRLWFFMVICRSKLSKIWLTQRRFLLA